MLIWHFFVWFHIVCDRYTSDYAHFTFPTPFHHFHFHPTLGLDSALILILRPNLFEAMFSNSDYEFWAKFTLHKPSCKEGIFRSIDRCWSLSFLTGQHNGLQWSRGFLRSGCLRKRKTSPWVASVKDEFSFLGCHHNMVTSWSDLIGHLWEHLKKNW